jgi:hypothetical protein
MLLDPRRYLSTEWQGADWKRAGQDLSERLVSLAKDVGAYIKGLKLGDLADVDFSTVPTNGQVPVWNTNAKKWRPGTVGGGGGGSAAYFAYTHAANYSITSSPFTTPFETVIRDDVGEYNTTTGELTPATSGPYILHLTLFDSQACAGGQWLTGEWVKTSSGGAHIGWFGSNADAQPANKFFTGSLVCYLEAGETYAPQIYGPGHLLAGGSDKMVLAGIKL